VRSAASSTPEAAGGPPRVVLDQSGALRTAPRCRGFEPEAAITETLPVPHGSWSANAHYLGCEWLRFPSALTVTLTHGDIVLHEGPNAWSGPIELGAGRIHFRGFLRETLVGVSGEVARSSAILRAALQQARGYDYRSGICDSGRSCLVLLDELGLPLVALAGETFEGRETSIPFTTARHSLSERPRCEAKSGAQSLGTQPLDGSWLATRQFVGCNWALLPAPATIKFDMQRRIAFASAEKTRTVEFALQTYRQPSASTHHVGSPEQDRSLLLIDFALRNMYEQLNRGHCRWLSLRGVPLLEIRPLDNTTPCPVD
jgi:hypothetical protein